MELYNFYSEQVEKSDLDKVNGLKDLFNELKQIFASDFIILVERKDNICIMGQIYGSDTNLGDLDLLTSFNVANINYTWLNAYSVSDNNINK